MKSFNYINDISDIYDIAYKHESLMSVMIELTSICNWSCEHCYVTDIEKDTYNMDNIEQLFLKLRQKGVNELVFIGGEMFTREDIMQVISLARSMFFRVVLESNISLLNKKTIKEIKNLYISEISCTIFSLDHKVHDNITQKKGALKDTLDNLELLYKNDIKVCVKTPLMKKNKYDYKELHAYLKEKKIKHSVTLNLFPKRDGTDINELGLTSEDIEKNIKEVDDINNRSFEKKEMNLFPCPNTRISLFLDHKGNAYPCVNYRQFLGNVFLNSLDDIWNNLERKKYLI